MKYKPGQSVVIKSHRTRKFNHEGKMDKYFGATMTISHIGKLGYSGNLYYKMKEDGGRWWWDDDMIERAAFSKSQLNKALDLLEV